MNLVSPDEAAAAGLDTEVSQEVVILRSAKAQRDARGRAQQGDFEGAKTVLREAADELRSHAAGSPNADALTRLAADIEEDLPFLEEGAFDASSSKRIHYKQMTSSYRRGSNGGRRSWNDAAGRTNPEPGRSVVPLG